MKLVSNWKSLLRRSWSIRWVALGGLCSVLMEYTDYLSFLPKWVLALIAVAGIYYRLVDQGLASGDADARK